MTDVAAVMAAALVGLKMTLCHEPDVVGAGLSDMSVLTDVGKPCRRLFLNR